jgi:protein phosphatase 1L
VSRAFGDRLLKKYVVAEPDVLEESLTGDDTLLIMATDGLWDVVSNQDAISMVRVRTSERVDGLPEGCAGHQF